MALGLRFSFSENITSVFLGDFFFFEFDLVITLYIYNKKKYLSVRLFLLLKALVHLLNHCIVVGRVIVMRK